MGLPARSGHLACSRGQRCARGRMASWSPPPSGAFAGAVSARSIRGAWPGSGIVGLGDDPVGGAGDGPGADIPAVPTEVLLLEADHPGPGMTGTEHPIGQIALHHCERGDTYEVVQTRGAAPFTSTTG